MARKSAKPIPTKVPVKYAGQITDSHCGPAVVQMLLFNVGVSVTQEQITDAAGVTETIETHGSRIDQLALAVQTLAPHVQMWCKDHAKMSDLIALVTQYKYPVGVEWQGLFDDPTEITEDTDTEDEEEDYGHYSVISFADRKTKQLIIVDPYKDYVEQDRIFSFEVFRKRWWDTNAVEDSKTGEETYVVDTRLMFIITPKSETFPEELGMRRL
jgi:hypothetical protein